MSRPAERATTSTDTSSPLPLIDETLLATTRYLEALTHLDDEALRGPSVLPGWTRAHVVAHLSRNADAFERVLLQAAAGEPASMYDSPESRNHDIDATVSRHDRAGLLRDAQEATARLEQAWRGCEADPSTSYTRVPGGDDTWPLESVGRRRRAEVEIHHADLDLGYGPDDWPADFSLAMVKQRQDEMAARPEGCPSMVLSSTDVDGLWKFGVGQGPEIHGTAGALAWWLVGRGDGRGLTSSSGELPAPGPWR
jgi:maleylpyruvate isomerase